MTVEVVARPEFCERYLVKVGEKVLPIERLEFTAEIRQNWIKMPFVQVANYMSETGTQVIAHWQGDPSGIVQELTMIATKRDS